MQVEKLASLNGTLPSGQNGCQPMDNHYALGRSDDDRLAVNVHLTCKTKQKKTIGSLDHQTMALLGTCVGCVMCLSLKLSIKLIRRIFLIVNQATCSSSAEDFPGLGASPWHTNGQHCV